MAASAADSAAVGATAARSEGPRAAAAATAAGDVAPIAAAATARKASHSTKRSSSQVGVRAENRWIAVTTAWSECVAPRRAAAARAAAPCDVAFVSAAVAAAVAQGGRAVGRITKSAAARDKLSGSSTSASWRIRSENEWAGVSVAGPRAKARPPSSVKAATTATGTSTSARAAEPQCEGQGKGASSRVSRAASMSPSLVSHAKRQRASARAAARRASCAPPAPNAAPAPRVASPAPAPRASLGPVTAILKRRAKSSALVRSAARAGALAAVSASRRRAKAASRATEAAVSLAK